MRLSPEPQTDSNQHSGSAGDPQVFPGKVGLGCSESVSNLVSGLLLGRKRRLLPTPRPAAAPHSFRDRMMSSSRSELSELSAAKETRGLCLVCGRGTRPGTGDGHPCPRLQLPGTDRASTISALQTTPKQPGNLHQSFLSLLKTEAQGEQL